MKVSRYILLVAFGAVLATGARAQTVEQVINKHIEAMGGKAKLLSLNSLYQEISMELMGGKVDTRNWQVKDRLWRMEVTFGSVTNVTVVTPTKGWVFNPLSNNSQDMTDQQVKLSQLQLNTTDQLVDYAAKGNKVALLKKDTACGKQCYPVQCTLPSGIAITYFIDMQTGYTVRQVMKEGLKGANNGNSVNAKGESVIDLGDYRPEGGYVLAHTMSMASNAVKMRVTKVEINKPIDVEALSKPK